MNAHVVMEQNLICENTAGIIRDYHVAPLRILIQCPFKYNTLTTATNAVIQLSLKVGISVLRPVNFK